MSDAIERLTERGADAVKAEFKEMMAELKIGPAELNRAFVHAGNHRLVRSIIQSTLDALAVTPDAAAGLADGSWVAVPREPSEAMRKAGMEESRMLHVSHPSVSRRASICTGEAGDIYRAMIAAQQNGEK